jgi:tetratricopeptide (TPR) repeat protein
VAAAVDVAIHSKSFELTEGLLNQLVAADPGDAILHVQLARLLQAKGDQAGSLAQLEAAQKLGPELPQVLRARADMLAAGKRFSEAADAYKQLLARQDQSGDARLHQQYAVVLMQLHQFVEAQHELIRALQLDAKLADAYGDLAVCASENKQYGLALQVLDARAKMLPETPGTYYLRATAFDNLRQFPQAAQNYKQFLSASNGKFPDEEWKARHRLAAIDKR